MIAAVERVLERFERLVRFALLHEDLGAAAPDHHEAIELVVALELVDVGADLFGEVALVLALFDVGSVEPLDVLSIEHRLPRADALHLGLDLLQQPRVEHAGRGGRAVAVVVEDVPAAKDDVVEAGEGNEILDQRRPAVGALAEPDGAHLGEGADRLGEVLPDGEDAGDEGRADGAEANQQNTELSVGRSDGSRAFHSRSLYHSRT